MAVTYFVRGASESWAVIRLTGGEREEIVADGLQREAAIELCFQKLKELPQGAVAVGELPLDEDIVPRPRPRQLRLKF